MNLVLVSAHMTRVSDAETGDSGLSGIPSAVLYLSDSLAGRGHGVTLIADGAVGRRSSGVRTESIRRVDAGLIGAADAVVVVNDARHAAALREGVRRGVPIVLWQHHGPGVRFLGDGATAHALDTAHRDAADAVVFVSDWQRRAFIDAYGLDARRCHVVRNACSPPFAEDAFTAAQGDAAARFAAKRAALEVAYVSAPERGLLDLLRLWPHVRRHVPAAGLAIYSGRTLYGMDDANDAYNRLLNGGIDLPGVTCRGVLDHRRLAAALRTTAIVAYPTTVEETSCIAVLEALAAECSVVCTDRGALPETTAGRAEIVPRPPGGAGFDTAFVSCLVQLLAAWRDGHPALAAHVTRQGRVFREAYTWRLRALEWETLFAHLRGPEGVPDGGAPP